MTTPTSVDQQAVCALLRKWIHPHLTTEGQQWVDDKAMDISKGSKEWVFFTSFSAVPRYTGKAELTLNPGDQEAAESLRAGWMASHWSVDQAARAIMALSVPSGDKAAYFETMNKVFNAADIGESVALYQCLPLFPHPESYVEQAQEGLRSNMTSVFQAVAQRNPFPMEYFGENAWNQMVLKSCFVGSSLHDIVGLDERTNANLAHMLVDYAHERWAASREVIPELWRPVGPYLGEHYMEDIERVLNDPNPTHQEAAALALSMSTHSAAIELLNTRQDLKEKIQNNQLNWSAKG